MQKLFLTLLFCLGFAVAASAQNPSAVTFGPSADHNLVSGGITVLTRYNALFKRVSDGVLVTTKDCGKPALASTLTCTLPSNLPPNTTLTVTMQASGPGGNTLGPVSNQFIIVINPPGPPGTPVLVINLGGDPFHPAVLLE